MSWALIILLIVTALYAAVSGVYTYTGNLPMAIMYGGYAMANCGPIMLELGT